MTDRLAKVRRSWFVGRAGEIELFQSALASAELPFQVLYLFGPGGVGKTTLLGEFAAVSDKNQAPAISVDARNVEPSPAAFIRVLEAALGLTPPQTFFKALASRRHRRVILVDTYEALEPLDAWLRDVFLPELPQHVLVVLAGRNPPAPAWRADPGWQRLLRVLPLRNLMPEESRTYLEKRRVPADQHQTVLDFTHGHPLALSLVADVYAQRPAIHFQPEAAPDVVKTLLEQFVQKVPGPAHRAALEACALVRVTTEPLLAQMLRQTDAAAVSADPVSTQGAHELFEWLRDLSFVESSAEGLFPHDLAREALIADVRWRNPDWYRELHNRARLYYTARLAQTHGMEQQRVLFDYVFLHRDNPVVRSMLEWQTGSGVADAMRAADLVPLVAMVAQHEGAASAKLARQWLERQPDGVTVYRDDKGEPIGFIAMLALERATPVELEADPATRVAWEYLRRHAPLRSGELATHYRFWMARDTYQNVSAVQTMIFLHSVRYQLTTPGLAFHFLPCANPEMWAGAFAYANLARLAETDFEIGGRRYGVYGHDWRVEPPLAWLALLAEREVAAEPQVIAVPARAAPIIVLSQPDFGAAARVALHDYSRPEHLRANPLLQSRIVTEKTGPGAATAERVPALQMLLKQAAESLQASPRDAKLYRALFHTYLQPAATQEQAAEILDLPFSTFRRHLKSGIDSVTEILWHQEIGR
ncbi:MAG: ATP-binding protein [Chloroflexi bacterium]|nr:ATP-binding protein [Chloroflexota bacterium]